MIPKKAYRDKVRQRLAEAQNLFLSHPDRLRTIIQLALFADQEKLQRMMHRTRTPRQPGTPTDSQAVNNASEHLMMLLKTDVLALLDALEPEKDT